MPTSAPRVSVLLPIRDAVATLDTCLRSLQRQTLAEFECLAVDDGSRDGSAARIAAAATADPRFRPLATGGRGIVAALELGLRCARAPLVARMDADDVARRDRLARQVAALDAEPGLDLVGCHVRGFPSARLSDGRRGYEDWLRSLRGAADVARDALVECPLAHPTWLGRTSVLRAVGYREGPFPEDYDLLLRLLERGGRVGVVPRRLLAWRERPGRLSRRCARYAPEAFLEAKVGHLCRTWLRGRRHYVLCGYGATGRALRRRLAREGRSPSAIVDVHPRRIGNRIAGVRVLAPDELSGLRGDDPILVSVAGAERRAQVRALLAATGRREGADFVCVA